MMRTNPFRFRHFTVQQDHAAQKVGVDAVIFGGWIQLKEKDDVLDIGTGTGILSLILRQRYPSVAITAIEIDQEACLDAKENFAAFNHSRPIELWETDFLHYDVNKMHDVLISNPPYFEEDLLSMNTTRNLARHGVRLSAIELFRKAFDCSPTSGELYVMYPYHRSAEIILKAENLGWYIFRTCDVSSRATQTPRLQLMHFTKERQSPEKTQLLVYDEEGRFTPTYKKWVEGIYPEGHFK